MTHMKHATMSGDTKVDEETVAQPPENSLAAIGRTKSSNFGTFVSYTLPSASSRGKNGPRRGVRVRRLTPLPMQRATSLPLFFDYSDAREAKERIQSVVTESEKRDCWKSKLEELETIQEESEVEENS